MKIFTKSGLAALIAATLLPSALSAFHIDDTTLKNGKIFGIQFSEGNSFYAQVALVSSISKSEYIVSNAVFVTEISIAIQGSPNSVRIYNAMPLNSEAFKRLAEGRIKPTTLEKLTALYDSVDTTLQSSAVEDVTGDIRTAFSAAAVHKDYPATTHAKSTEFVVASIAELDALYARIYSDYAGISKKNAKSVSKNPDSDVSKSASDDKIIPKMNGRLYVLEKVNAAAK